MEIFAKQKSRLKNELENGNVEIKVKFFLDKWNFKVGLKGGNLGHIS